MAETFITDSVEGARNLRQLREALSESGMYKIVDGEGNYWTWRQSRGYNWYPLPIASSLSTITNNIKTPIHTMHEKDYDKKYTS